MRHVCAFLFVVTSLPAAVQTGSCTPVSGSQITGADLARVMPVFAALPSDIPVAPSPGPGGTRTFHVGELQQLAARNGLIGEFRGDVCFGLAMSKLDKDALLAAMHKSRGMAEARIEIAEFMSDPVPSGRIEFASDNLVRPARADVSTPVLWNGSLVTDDHKRYPIWAKVLIVATVTQLVATEDLKPGSPVHVGQVRLEEKEGFPDLKSKTPSVEAITGMVPIRSVAEGGLVLIDNLKWPADVSRGDTVHVEVRLGAMRIGLAGFAESAGRAGETIAIRNPVTGKTFQARIESRGSVVVEPVWEK